VLPYAHAIKDEDVTTPAPLAKIKPAHEADAVGTIGRLWRYPVKSMRGERCESFAVNTRAIEGDRLFAVRDNDGKFGSGKSTRRFRQMDGLFAFDAVYDGSVPVMRFPEGPIMRGDHPDIDAVLSQRLGQPVTFVQEMAVSHLDAGPVHLLTTAALRWLTACLPPAAADERRFRPNLLIYVPGNTHIEQGWVGKIVYAGEAVRLRGERLD
jgi:uncharacterized protein YcbX